ncbi:MAG: HAMP domain-containing protein [Clostridia bacterium]|nr:HAMP domain-containing protein [Clostridia bacterium]
MSRNKVEKEMRMRRKATMLVIFTVLCSTFIMAMLTMLLVLLGIMPTFFTAGLWGTVIFLCACSIIGGFFAALVTRLFVKPVDDLISATKKAADGDFSVRVRPQYAFEEISELAENFNNMMAELEGIELFRSGFINDFSHEFKTPLVSIRGFAKQLENDDISDEEKKLYAGIIVSECERLSNMSKNILLLSKLENQQYTAKKEVFSLDEQLRKSVLLFEHEIEAKNIELDIDLADCDYIGDEEIMSQIWINLLSNALKYTPDGGKIGVLLFIRAREICVRIKDTGIGIKKESLDRIFEKFYQEDPSHKASGNGLGLPLVKRIVEIVGGRISVESEAGKGTCVSVYLPREIEKK